MKSHLERSKHDAAIERSETEDSHRIRRENRAEIFQVIRIVILLLVERQSQQSAQVQFLAADEDAASETADVVDAQSRMLLQRLHQTESRFDELDLIGLAHVDEQLVAFPRVADFHAQIVRLQRRYSHCFQIQPAQIGTAGDDGIEKPVNAIARR